MMSSDYALIIADNEVTKEIKIIGDFWYDKGAAEEVARRESSNYSKEWRIRDIPNNI